MRNIIIVFRFDVTLLFYVVFKRYRLHVFLSIAVQKQWFEAVT